MSRRDRQVKVRPPGRRWSRCSLQTRGAIEDAPTLRRLDRGALVEVDTILRVLSARQAGGGRRREAPRPATFVASFRRLSPASVIQSRLPKMGAALSRPSAARDRT